MIPRSDTTVIDGQFVSQRVSQVVEAIREYDPDIEVQWAPPSSREPEQAAFRIMHFPKDGQMPYVMFHVKTEEEFDNRVLLRIMANDQKNGKQDYNEFALAEEANRRVLRQKYLDEIEEQHEIAAAIFKSRKSSYRVNDDLVIKDGIPFNAAGL